MSRVEMIKEYRKLNNGIKNNFYSFGILPIITRQINALAICYRNRFNEEITKYA